VAKVVESIGKTYDEALKSGLEQIGLSEDEVNIEIIKSPSTKKSFFSILEAREVKLLITEKNSPKTNENAHKEKEIVELDEDTKNSAKSKIEAFLNEYIKTMELSLTYDINYDKGIINVTLEGENSGIVIGHRGETLEALQTYVTAVVNKDSETRIRLVFDSENYREKRAKSLAGLAHREAEKVIRTKRNYTFEPMTAFERKAIHTALQNNSKVETHSIGEEPYRKVVIALK
jgi:spoIIIJ-associated protein